MERLKLAVIGVGKLGKLHSRVISELQDAELVYVVDIIKERAEEVGSEYSAEPLLDYKQVRDVDGVIIATPTYAHYEIASYFAEMGINILVEKPIASRGEDAMKLLSLAKEKNVVLHVGHVERFNPAARKLFEIEEKPNFIRAQRLSPFTGRSLDIDVVQDLMIHDLEIILSLLGQEPEIIHASGVTFITGKLDFATAILKFPTCIAEVTSSRIYDKKLRRLDAFFPSGLYIKLDFAQNTFARFTPTLYGIEEEWIRIVSKEPLRAQMERFLRAIRGQEEAWDETAVKALVLAERISSSAEANL